MSKRAYHFKLSQKSREVQQENIMDTAYWHDLKKEHYLGLIDW